MGQFFKSMWVGVCRLAASIFGGSGSDSPAPNPEPMMPEETVADLLPSLDHLRGEWNTRDDDIRWETAITLAEMSALAYTVPHNRELVTRLLGFDEVEIPERGSMSGFLAITDDVAVVAFRGTDMYSPDDWLANADFRERTPLGEGRKVHRGFYNAYSLFAKGIKSRLGERKPRYLWITGHSLGGAMAACCAYDFIANDVSFTGLVTFGQPRIGNRVIAQYLEDSLGTRYMRYVNEGDLVPLVPPGIGVTLPDYWHCGVRIRFKAGELDRWEGLNLFSAAPMESNAATETTDDEGNDGEETLTEKETAALQKYLQATQPPEAAADLPESLSGNAPPEHTAAAAASPPATAMPAYSGWSGGLLGSIQERIADHSMIEYLRQLNEFRRNDKQQ